MDTLFLKILNMSIKASVVVLAVILLRLLLQKAPKYIRIILWGLVAVRLICPFSIESVFGLIPSAEPIVLEPAFINPLTDYNRIPIISSNAVQGIENNADIGFAPIEITAAHVWIIGMVIMVLLTGISYWRIRKITREAMPVKDNIYQCDNIPTPFIMGIIHPKIFLPSSMVEKDMEYVIAHENAHLKRYDHCLKPFGFLLLIIHWFNPFVWIAYILFCRDIELACDEKVITEMGIEKKKSYSNALINCSASSKILSACPLAFGEVGVKTRIKNVLGYKKPALYISITAVVACVVVAVCFLTNSDGMKINQIEDCGGFGYIFNNVTSLKIVKNSHSIKVEDTEATLKNLKKIRLEPNPLSISLSNSRDKTYQIVLGNGNTLCFNHELNEMWIDTSVKPSYTYVVKNPEIVEEIFINTASRKSLYTDDWTILNVTANIIGFQFDMEDGHLAQFQATCNNGFMSGISTISKEKEKGIDIITNANNPVCWHPDNNSESDTEIEFNVYKNDRIVDSGTISIKYNVDNNGTYEIKLLDCDDLYLQQGTDEYEGVIFITNRPSARQNKSISIFGTRY